MVINNWCEIGVSACPGGTPSYTDPWKYKLLLNASGDYMVPPPPPPLGFGDLFNLAGIAGQNSSPFATTPFIRTPLDKVFDSHFIVQIPAAMGNQYYDASYGVTYPSETGFQSQAVAGYAQQRASDAGPNYHFGLVGTAGLPTIVFTPVGRNSMPPTP
jgi:hypothetical protein